jgi:hypothetical protein
MGCVPLRKGKESIIFGPNISESYFIYLYLLGGISTKNLLSISPVV